MRAAVLGASGYAGAEVLRLLAGHPHHELVLATADSNAGEAVSAHSPHLAAAYPNTVFAGHDRVFDSDAEVVFLALPHGVSQHYVAALRAQGRLVVDLGADFRLKDPADYAEWYGAEHTQGALLDEAIYALVERHRGELGGASLLAIPGCYPTATALALGPFLDANWVTSTGLVVNALSGASGAGRATSDRLHFSRLAGNAEAYGLLRHRHTIEMQQELGCEILFTPHLVPVARGMLVTAYARTSKDVTTEDTLGLLHATYESDPFVVVTKDPPTLKDPVGSNLCFVSARVDERTGWLIAMSSIDNLLKGAAGQAVQALNVSVGDEETLSLPTTGVSP